MKSRNRTNSFELRFGRQVRISGVFAPHAVGSREYAALDRRTLHLTPALTEIGSGQNSTIVFPLPIEMLRLGY